MRGAQTAGSTSAVYIQMALHGSSSTRCSSNVARCLMVRPRPPVASPLREPRRSTASPLRTLDNTAK